MAKQYDESSIRVLRGLEPIRLRPGMYTRTENPTHILIEAIDNAVDEAQAGFASEIGVTLYRDGSASVRDNGRGIPTGKHPEEGVPTVQVVFTVIHSGGKFDKDQADSSYRFSGGLHGVGVSVTNALSSRLEVEVKRDGKIHALAFAGGEVAKSLSVVGTCKPKETGTTIRLWPDPQYFDSPTISRNELTHLLRAKAMLLPGVKVTLSVENADGFELVEWHFPNGMAQYFEETHAERELICPVFSGEKYHRGSADYSDGEGVSWALAWGNEKAFGESYVNMIPTVAGGTHESGLRSATFDAVREFAEHHGLMQRNVKLAAEDVWHHLNFVLAARMVDPAFAGQTKDKLSSREALKLVQGCVKDALDLWLNSNVEAATRIAEQAIKLAVDRTRSAKAVERKKSSGVAVMPGKLTDCEASGPGAELFLVEGDSAGGSAKGGRDKETQAILPLRGKGLNAWEVERGQILANQEIHDIAASIGIDPHGYDDEVNLAGLRYGKVILMADADDDGLHIQALLLTLFLRHFPALLKGGHVYIAHPPLFRVDVPGQGKGRPPRKLYALDRAELETIETRLQQEGIKTGGWEVSRFKGLGEMSAGQLWETTLCPDTRKMVRVSVDDLQATHAMFDVLMGKGNAEKRREMIQEFRGEEQ